MKLSQKFSDVEYSRFLRDRVKEVPGLNCSINFPHEEFTTGRALRTSPIFPKLQLAGAQFGQVYLIALRTSLIFPKLMLAGAQFGQECITINLWNRKTTFSLKL